MCNNATVSPSTTPGDLAGKIIASGDGSKARGAIVDRPTHAACKCCTGLIVKDGKHDDTPKTALRQQRYTGGDNGQYAIPFYAKITIDTYAPASGSSSTGKGRVIVSTLMTAVNFTQPSEDRPNSVKLDDATVAEKIRTIPNGIARIWNAKPLKLDITDSSCGRNVYDLVFDPQIIFPKTGSSVSGSHYTVKFVNVKGLGTERTGKGTLEGQAYVLGREAIFNIREDRTVMGGRKGLFYDSVEAHEYGHMIGLKDEYNNESRDRGGVNYILPDGKVQQAKGQGHLMDTMQRQQTASQARYATTIAYTVQAILNSKGRNVSRLEIIGEYI